MAALSAATHKGIDAVRLAKTFFLIAFVYLLVYNYGAGTYSLVDIVNDGVTDIVQMLSPTSADNFLNAITQANGGMSPLITMLEQFAKGQFLLYMLVYISVSVLSAVTVFTMAYGIIAAAVTSIFGPIFIPFLLFQKTEWLFWGWFRAFIGFSFYRAVNAAVLYVLSVVMVNATTLSWYKSSLSNPLQLGANYFAMISLYWTCIFILFKVPHITSSIFSGHTGSSSGVTGAAIAAVKMAGTKGAA